MSDAVELADVPQLFERWLAGRPLADRSRREYARNVRVYCAWLAATPDRDGWQGDPLIDPLARVVMVGVVAVARPLRHDVGSVSGPGGTMAWVRSFVRKPSPTEGPPHAGKR